MIDAVYTTTDAGEVNGLLSPSQLFGIDTKYADGLSRSGRIRYGALIPVVGEGEMYPHANTEFDCSDGADQTKYNLTFSHSRSCNMIIQAIF